MAHRRVKAPPSWVIIRVSVEGQRAQTSSPQPNLSIGMRPSNPPNLHCHRSLHPKPTKNILVRFVLATGSHPMLCVCFVVSGMQGQSKRTIYGYSFPMQVYQYFIIAHQVLTHLIHTRSPMPSHISPYFHSLGGKDNSLSYLASTTKAGNQHQNQGGRRRKDSAH